MSRIVYKIPSFTDEDGCVFSEIEVIIESDADLCSTARLACSIQKSLSPRTESPAPSPNRCRRASGNPRAWFSTRDDAVAFAENPAHWPAYRGDVPVLCLKPGCGGWHLSQPHWADALAAAKARVN